MEPAGRSMVSGLRCLRFPCRRILPLAQRLLGAQAELSGCPYGDRGPAGLHCLLASGWSTESGSVFEFTDTRAGPQPREWCGPVVLADGRSCDQHGRKFVLSWRCGVGAAAWAEDTPTATERRSPSTSTRGRRGGGLALKRPCERAVRDCERKITRFWRALPGARPGRMES